MLTQPTDSQLAVPQAPSVDRFDDVCDLLDSDEAHVSSCTQCGSFSFHLVKASPALPRKIVCAGCLCLVG